MGNFKIIIRQCFEIHIALWVRRYNVHVRFVQRQWGQYYYVHVTIDQGGLLSQLGGLIVTMGWTNCHWAMRACTLIHAGMLSIWGVRLGWLGRMREHWCMRAHRSLHAGWSMRAHWSMMVCYPYGGARLGWLGQVRGHWSMRAQWSMHAQCSIQLSLHGLLSNQHL